LLSLVPVRPGIVAGILLALVAAIIALGAIGIARYPALFSQPGALAIVLRLAFVLAAYTLACAWGRRRDWGGGGDVILGAAALYGSVGGTLEILNIAIENGLPVGIHTPALAMMFMVVIFGSWGAAGFRVARSLRSIQAGTLAAVSSAVVCMLIAVTAGFAIELLIVPPDPGYVAIWAEFKRSGWTDARAFGLANTLDSGFTHLALAPVIALGVGGTASFLACIRRKS